MQNKMKNKNNWNLHARTGRSSRPHPLPLLILHLMSYVLKFPLNLGFMIHIYDLITIHLLRLASFQISNRPLPSPAIQEPKSPGKHRSRQPWSSFVISCQSEQRFGHSDEWWVCSWIPSGEPAGQSRQPQSEPSGRRRRGSWSRSWFRLPSFPPPSSPCCSCYSPSQPVGLIVGDL